MKGMCLLIPVSRSVLLTNQCSLSPQRERREGEREGKREGEKDSRKGVGKQEEGREGSDITIVLPCLYVRTLRLYKMAKMPRIQQQKKQVKMERAR